MHSFRFYICTAVTACFMTLAAMPLTAQAQAKIVPISSKDKIVSGIPEETEVSGDVASLSVSEESEERPEIVGDYKSGKWNGNTYINTWADYQITLPKDCQKESIASSSSQSHYDFLALVPKVGVSLRVAFNELKNQDFDSSITEEDFGKLLAERQGNDTTTSEFETVSYGGREYTHFSVTHQDQLIQDFYLRRVSHYMMIISFSHAVVSELHAEDILDTLTYASDLN